MNRCLDGMTMVTSGTTYLSSDCGGQQKRMKRMRSIRSSCSSSTSSSSSSRNYSSPLKENETTGLEGTCCYEISDKQNMYEQRSETVAVAEEAKRRSRHNNGTDEVEEMFQTSRRRKTRRRRTNIVSHQSSFFADNTLPKLALFLTVLLSLAFSSYATMWDRCEPCVCKWISGKKAAECTGKNLSVVPQNLSSDLQVIELSQNEIPELRKNEFLEANLQNVHKLFMRNCTLQYIHRDALRGLEILIELDLSYNNLSELPVGLFHPLSRLRTVVLNNNQIEVIEDGSFKSLVHLHKIELKNNKIHSVGLTAFASLPLLAVVDLDMNRLRNLKKASFDHLDKLTGLSIRYNPWNCTCDLEEFKEFVKNRNLFTQPACYDPPALRDKLWSELTEKFACRPRVLRIRPASRFRSVAENETLECEIYGSPRPEIYWLFNKKPLNSYDNRYKMRAVESYTKNGADVFVTKLTVVSMRSQDKGAYTCVASNSGGKDEGHIYMERSNGGGGFFPSATDGDGNRTIFGNIYVLIALIFLAIVALFAMVISVLICCRRGSICPLVGNKKYKGGINKSTMSERGLIQSKLNDKTQNDSMIEGGSVIMEVQKSLLTEVNPVEKPPRRTEVDANGTYHDVDDKNDLKKTLLDDTAFGSHDDETQSVALSDATPRSRQTFVDDGYGTSLPPDLLAFSNRYGGGGGAGPVLAMTASTPGRGGGGSVHNLPMNHLDTTSLIYGQSPLASPIYSGAGSHGGPGSAGIYGTIGHNHGPMSHRQQGFRTLPHQRYASSTLLPGASSRLNPSPLPPGAAGRSFTPGPIIYQPSAMLKQQGYVTIPRKPRTPSWAPSVSSTNTNTTHLDSMARNNGRMTPTSPTSIASSSVALDRDYVEPVYDNLGMRTTASGNSVLNVNKVGGGNGGRSYTMKDRPLPATPGQQTPVAVAGGVGAGGEPLYDFNKQKKVPPLPPPKPQKKKMSVMSNGSGTNVSQLYQDEGDDGTEV